MNMDQFFGRVRDRPREQQQHPPAQPAYAQPVPNNYPRVAQPVSNPPLAQPVNPPTIAQPVGGYGGGQLALYPRVGMPPTGLPPSSSGPVPGAAGSGGIRVVIKPEYRVMPAVQLSQNGDVPRSQFVFEFDLERQVLSEAEGGLFQQKRPSADHRHSNGGAAMGPTEDPVVTKYCGMGYPREAVLMAVAAFGDVQNKVVDFCTHYGHMKEMGFAPEAISGALAMYDNDVQKSIMHLAGG